MYQRSINCVTNFVYCYFFNNACYLVTSNIGSQAKSSSAQTSEHRSQKFRDTVNHNVIRSTNKSSSENPSSTPNTHLRLPTSTSEPHIGNRRAWPAATTVLAQAASTGKAKNRYIDILIPRYHCKYSCYKINFLKNIFDISLKKILILLLAISCVTWPPLKQMSHHI